MVLGLGRFGASLALELVRGGTDVLGVDSKQRVVQKFADELTHSAVADTTDIEALRQLDVPDYQRAVVGIGSDLEASTLTTAVVVDLGSRTSGPRRSAASTASWNGSARTTWCCPSTRWASGSRTW